MIKSKRKIQGGGEGKDRKSSKQYLAVMWEGTRGPVPHVPWAAYVRAGKVCVERGGGRKWVWVGKYAWLGDGRGMLESGCGWEGKR